MLRRLALVLLLWSAAALPAPANEAAVLDRLAGDIAAGLARGRPMIERLAADLGWTRAARPRLAVLPFRPGETAPVPDDEARRLNEALADALVRRADLGADVVARADIERVLRDARNFDDRALDRLLAGARADIAVIGNLAAVEGGIELRYRAVAASGHVLATAGPQRVAYDWRSAGALALDAAIEQAAQALAAQAPDLRRLSVQRLLLQPGGGHTTAGKYLAEHLGERLGRRLADKATDGVWMPTGRLEQAPLDSDRHAVEKLAAAEAGHYVLSGDYWLLGGAVEALFRLRGAGGETVRRIRIRRDALTAMLPATARADDPLADDDPGPHRLMLSSARGADPVYRVGEDLHLVVRTEKPGHLYCFVRQSRGGVVRVFPNRLHRDSRIAAGRQLLIPGEGMGFRWEIEPPAGENIVRCFVVDREVLAELPRAVAAADFEPLPGIADLAMLRGPFQALPRTAISVATLRMTVEE